MTTEVAFKFISETEILKLYSNDRTKWQGHCKQTNAI